MAAMIQRPVDRLISRGIVVAFLLIFFALALDTAGRKAITTDEPLHLTHAIAMHQTGVMPIPEMHTPLTYRLISSLLGTEPPLPDITTLDTWPGQTPTRLAASCSGGPISIPTGSPGSAVSSSSAWGSSWAR